MEKREQTMVQELLEIEEGLREREVDFIEHLSKKPAGYKLSEAQLKWLEIIWNREILKKFR